LVQQQRVAVCGFTQLTINQRRQMMLPYLHHLHTHRQTLLRHTHHHAQIQTDLTQTYTHTHIQTSLRHTTHKYRWTLLGHMHHTHTQTDFTETYAPHTYIQTDLTETYAPHIYTHARTINQCRQMSLPYLHHLHISHTPCRSTQSCIPPGWLNRVPASVGVRAGISALPSGR